MNTIESGILLVDKPIGATSFACVNAIKKLLPKKSKVGHTGTLDPFASGLLIICIGKEATGNVEAFMELRKTYQAIMMLGIETDTLDNTGMTLRSESVSHITKDSVIQAFKMFPRKYLQVPPAFSALKYEGKALYQHIRDQSLNPEQINHILVEKQKEVCLYDLKLISSEELPLISFEATVSKGTYIRSLSNDIAHQMGTIATTVELRRTQTGPFSVSEAKSIEFFDSLEKITSRIIPISLVNQYMEAL